MPLLQRLNDLDDKVLGPRPTNAELADRVGYTGFGAAIAFAMSDRFTPSVMAFVVSVAATTYAAIERRRRRTA